VSPRWHRRRLPWVCRAWASPATLLGMALALPAVRGGRLTVVDGVIEAYGPWLRWVLRRFGAIDGGVAAITFGHVVLAQDADALHWTRAHERVHVRQYERWGPFFIPAYITASAWAVLRGRHVYYDNRFEREARDYVL